MTALPRTRRGRASHHPRIIHKRATALFAVAGKADLALRQLKRQFGTICCKLIPVTVTTNASRPVHSARAVSLPAFKLHAARWSGGGSGGGSGAGNGRGGSGNGGSSGSSGRGDSGDQQPRGNPWLQAAAGSLFFASLTAGGAAQAAPRKGKEAPVRRSGTRLVTCMHAFVARF